MWIGLLGPLEVRDAAGGTIDVAGGRLRALLGRLALDAGRLVTVDALVDTVWPDEPPAGAGNALQTLVSRLRRLGIPVQTLPGGYRLPDVTVDAVVFSELVAAGQAARDPSPFHEALALMRGSPLADLGGAAWMAEAAARLTERHLAAAEELAELHLSRSDPTAALAQLSTVVADHPQRESARGLQLRALHAAGRTADALTAYADLRTRLAESLGVDPSPALRDLHAAILRDEVPAPVGNLRTALTSFVGREDDLARLGAALDDARLVTLVGPGGAGKTRLAIELASRRASRLPDGAWLVELAGVGDGLEVPTAILSALGRRDGGLLGGPEVTGTERVVTALRDRELLLVLDNCEHILDACAEVAEAVVGRCPGVRLLVTTREPLALTGEVLCPLSPLPVPPTIVDVNSATQFAAVQLFVDRARDIRRDFALTADNLAEVVEVCRRLDGLPLAIELACARLRTLPLADIASRLGDRFRLLTGGSRTALARHQTLLAVIGWSWDLFTVDEQRLARRLAVFVGGATVASAEAVCGGGGLDEADVLGLLGALVDKSFVQLQPAPDGTARYVTLDSVRAYAAGRLAEAEEAGSVRLAHARYFLDRVESAEPLLRTGAQLTAVGWLECEYDNVTAALRWAIDSGDRDLAIRLVSGLGWYWMLRGGRSEPAAWFSEALAVGGSEAPLDALAVAYAYDAVHRFSRRDLDGAAASARRVRELAAGRAHPAVAFVDIIGRTGPSIGSILSGLSELAEHPDPWIAAAGWLVRGHAAEGAGDAAGAAVPFDRARAAFAAVGDRWGTMMALSALAGSLSVRGDHAAAIEAMTQAAALADAVRAVEDAAWTRGRRGTERLRSGDIDGAAADLAHARADGESRRSPVLTALADLGLADVARARGDAAQARDLLDRTLDALGASDGTLQPRLRVLAFLGLGRAELALGSVPAAAGHLAQARSEVAAIGDARATAEVAEALAALAVASGDPARAGTLLGLAAAARGSVDHGSPDVRATTEAARTDPGYAAAYTAATALSPAEATAQILTLS